MLRLCFLFVLQASVFINSVKLPDHTGKNHGYAISLDSMVPLLKLKEQSSQNLERYVNQLKTLKHKLQLVLVFMKNLLGNSKNQSDLYIHNRIYTYKLVRHMYLDCPKWLELIKKPVGSQQSAYAQQLLPLLPTDRDYFEALKAIFRLQTTYKLDPGDLAAGILREKRYGKKPWSALECFMLGVYYHKQAFYQDAAYWLELALYYYDEPKNLKVLQLLGCKYEEILVFLVESSKEQGRYAAALVYASEILEFQPNHSYIKSQFPKLQELSEQIHESKPPVRQPNNFASYCRKLYAPKVNGVQCRYQRTTPFLQLAPIKAEDLTAEPVISLYHELLNNDEIDVLKNLARPHLERDTFYGSWTEESFKDYSKRITFKFTTLDDDIHKLMQVLNQRIADASGLSLQNAEKLHIINYGIAGHSYAHNDFANRSSGGFWDAGDRAVTVLIYLSDVKHGGETVFPFHNLRVQPQKGSMLVYPNLLLDSQPDWTNLHISCPVIIGDKWLGYKWLRDKPQMFIRSCPKYMKHLLG